jgi:hypothetical protein
MKNALKSGCILGIALLCCLALAHTTLRRFHRRTPKTVNVPQKGIKPAPKIERKKAIKRNQNVYAHLIPKPVDPEVATRRIILDNNIFAPLGKAKKNAPAYLLIGTYIPRTRNPTGGIEAQAILQEKTESASIHIVTIGTKLGADTFVYDIQPQKVTLKKGKQWITLRLGTFHFLNPSRTGR